MLASSRTFLVFFLIILWLFCIYNFMDNFRGLAKNTNLFNKKNTVPKFFWDFHNTIRVFCHLYTYLVRAINRQCIFNILPQCYAFIWLAYIKISEIATAVNIYISKDCQKYQYCLVYICFSSFLLFAVMHFSQGSKK